MRLIANPTCFDKLPLQHNIIKDDGHKYYGSVYVGTRLQPRPPFPPSSFPIPPPPPIPTPLPARLEADYLRGRPQLQVLSGTVRVVRDGVLPRGRVVRADPARVVQVVVGP